MSTKQAKFGARNAPVSTLIAGKGQDSGHEIKEAPSEKPKHWTERLSGMLSEKPAEPIPEGWFNIRQLAKESGYSERHLVDMLEGAMSRALAVRRQYRDASGRMIWYYKLDGNTAKAVGFGIPD